MINLKTRSSRPNLVHYVLLLLIVLSSGSIFNLTPFFLTSLLLLGTAFSFVAVLSRGALGVSDLSGILILLSAYTIFLVLKNIVYGLPDSFNKQLYFIINILCNLYFHTCEKNS